MSQSKSAVVSISGHIKVQTTRAICFICDPEKTEFETVIQEQENLKGIWFPFSQVNEIHTPDPTKVLDQDRLVVTQWIAKQKGILS